MALELQNGSPLSPLCPVATPRPGQVGEALPLWFKWGGGGGGEPLLPVRRVQESETSEHLATC